MIFDAIANILHIEKLCDGYDIRENIFQDKSSEAGFTSNSSKLSKGSGKMIEKVSVTANQIGFKNSIKRKFTTIKYTKEMAK